MFDGEDLRTRVIGLIRENERLYRRYVAGELKDLELTGAEARTAAYIGAHPGSTQAELAGLLDIQPITLTRIIDKLEAGGWAERRASDTDRRARLIHLTAKGKTVARKIAKVHEQIDQELTANLSQRELAELEKSLAHINRGLMALRGR